LGKLCHAAGGGREKPREATRPRARTRGRRNSPPPPPPRPCGERPTTTTSNNDNNDNDNNNNHHNSNKNNGNDNNNNNNKTMLGQGCRIWKEKVSNKAHKKVPAHVPQAFHFLFRTPLGKVRGVPWLREQQLQPQPLKTTYSNDGSYNDQSWHFKCCVDCEFAFVSTN